MSHTPGPWNIDMLNEQQPSSIYSEDHGTIALFSRHRAMIENARLIAAAPDLLAALARQVDNMAFALNHVSMPDSWYEKFYRELEEARAAIARAKGEA